MQANNVRAGRRGPLAGAAVLGIALVAASAVAGAQERYRPLVQGGPPPDFALPDTAGRTVHLSDFRGRAILLSFISCYTDTCFEPINAFEALFARLGPARLAVLSVCTEVPEALARDRYAGLLRNCSAGQRILIDQSGASVRAFFANEVPTSILIGPDFTVREVLAGVAALRDPGLPARIEALSAESAAAGPRP